MVAWIGFSGCVVTEQKETAEPTKAPEQASSAAQDAGPGPASSQARPDGGEDISGSAAASAGAQDVGGGQRPAVPAAAEDVSGAAAGGDAMAFELGLQLGEQTTRSAWMSLSKSGGCDSVEKLAEVIGRSSGRIFANAESQGAEMAQYAEGYVHGMRTALNEIAVSCSDRCAPLCELARTAGKAILCEAAKRLGAEVRLSKPQPPIRCPAGTGCDSEATVVAPGDCP